MLGAPPPPPGGDRDDDGAAKAQEMRVGPVAPPPSPRELVLTCADRLHRRDVDGAQRVVEVLLSVTDPRGDAADRLAHHFARALARRVDGKGASPAPAPSPSAYLAYNQIVPFLRFAHLTANQAILEAIGAARRVHIVDLDAAHGVQWPPLLQAIVEGADPDVGPPEVRVTGVGTDRDVLHRTGDRLRAFASSLNLPFHFHPLHLPCLTQLAAVCSNGLELHPDETLAINSVLFLHRLSGEGDLADFLRWIKSMNPTVVTIAERESSIGADYPEDLPRRVSAAMDYYSAVFDALEAMVPPGRADRLSVEHEVLGQEIDAAIDPCPAAGWRARRFEWWASATSTAGLSPRPLSTFAVSQARFLLRLHYPSSEGYIAEEALGACFLRWHTRLLMSVSSWQ